MKRQRFRGVSLVEKLMALGAMTGLAVLLLATVNRSRLKSRQQTATCFSNLQQLARAIHLYVQDNNGAYPAAVSVNRQSKSAINWYDVVAPYVKSPRVFSCPTSNSFRTALRIHDEYPKSNYYLNSSQLNVVNPIRGTGWLGKRQALIARPTLTLMNMESYETVATLDGHYIPQAGMAREAPTACDHSFIGGVTYHAHGGNYSFADGHVKWLTPEALAEVWCQTDVERQAEANRRRQRHK